MPFVIDSIIDDGHPDEKTFVSVLSITLGVARHGLAMEQETGKLELARWIWSTIRPALLQHPHAAQHSLTSILSQEDVWELGIRPLEQTGRLIQQR